MDDKKILLELINTHRRDSRRIYCQILCIIIPLTLISVGGFIYCLYEYVKPIPYLYSGTYKAASYATGSIGGVLFFVLCLILYVRSSNNHDLNIFSNDNTEILIWRLDNDQWISYLEYSYGPNRSFKALSCLSWRFRRERYNRLKDRGHGYIIFTVNGFIIDELQVFRFERKIVLTLIELLSLPNQSILLRFHTLHLRLLEDKKRVNQQHIKQASLYFDIFVPNIYSQPLERLYQMVNLFNIPPLMKRYSNPNFNQIRSLFHSR